MSHNIKYLIERSSEIIAPYLQGELQKTRDDLAGIFKGGKSSLEVLFGVRVAEKYDYNRMPVPPTLTQGLNRLAQKFSSVPGVKVNPASSKPSARKFAYDRQRIVQWMDETSNLNLLLPQISRWTPVYGYGVYVVNHKRVREGRNWVYYPELRIRDSRNSFPSSWMAGDQPEELVTIREVSRRQIENMYGVTLQPRMQMQTYQRVNYVGWTPGVLLEPHQDTQGGVPIVDGVTVMEFRDETGIYLYLPEYERILDYIDTGGLTPFRVEARFDFRQLGGQYDHSIGLLAMETRINILMQTFMADGINRETNIIGADGLSQTYVRGRKSINYLPPGSNVMQPQNNMPYQVFQLLGLVNKQIRDSASYPQTDDATSNISFITGEGIQQLQASLTLEIQEYQTVRANVLKQLDALRLEWDEVHFGGQTKEIYLEDGKLKYDPEKAIRGFYRTTRNHGILDGFDRPAQIVTGIQLIQSGVLDLETFRESLGGLGDLNEIVNNIRKQQATDAMFAFLTQAAQGQDQSAMAALVEIQQNPGNMEQILAKWFSPQEPELSSAEQAFLNGPAAQPELDSTTVLARLNASGSPALGVQNVGRV